MEDYIISSGNIFKDMELPNAEERLAKAKIAVIINKIIEERGLTQKEAAKILGINQPKVSALKNGRLKGFSIERLFSYLEALDQHIEITITDKSKIKTEQGIHVAYV
ncbi:MAG: XRE family transcriptional regulator [Calditrichaceae bacterium]|nr:helix-turn-helix domain-containing protein [Calditrichia bacterium]NUQ44298.1 XRE family transcriptional regulator [Calditrichaceae bacterium]